MEFCAKEWLETERTLRVAKFPKNNQSYIDIFDQLKCATNTFNQSNYCLWTRHPWVVGKCPTMHFEYGFTRKYNVSYWNRVKIPQNTLYQESCIWSTNLDISKCDAIWEDPLGVVQLHFEKQLKIVPILLPMISKLHNII